MFFHFKIFLQSVGFFLALEIMTLGPVSDFLGGLFRASIWGGGLLLVLVAVYAFRTAHRISKRATMTPIPIIFFLGSLGLLYFINSPIQQHIFICIASAIYYFSHLGMYRLRTYDKDQTARGIVGATALAAIFFAYCTIYGIYLNFVFPLWALMLAFLCISTLVSFQYLWLIKKDKQSVWSYSLVLGLVMTEIAWVMNSWPFGYLTTAVVTLMFYYVFWDMVQSHFLGLLSKKRVVANMVFFGILAAIVLGSSHWLPVV